MRWIFGRGKEQSVPTWEYISKGIIWRLFPFEPGCIIGEDRDTEKKTVSFFCLDEITGKLRWSELRCPEPWWVSMEAIHNGVLILHEYAAPDMPDHKKIHAVDAASGEILWVNDDVKFLFCQGNSLYAAKDTYEQRLFFEMQLSTGKLLREVDVTQVAAARQLTENEVRSEVIFPSIVPYDSTEAVMVRSIPGITNEVEDDSQIEFINSGAHQIVAICKNVSLQPPTRMYSQHLYVYRKTNQKITYSDTMNQSLAVPVPDMYFMKGNFVYYIKEKTILRAVRFTGEQTA